MAIAPLRVPISALPAFDSGSFFKNLTSTVGDAIDNKVAGDLVLKSLQAGAQPNANQVPPSVAPPSQTGTAPVIPVDRGPAQGSTYQPFIQTVQQNGLTNPYGLAAVAATGRAESGYDPNKANSTWADPSVSGQAGTSGGIMSWRGPRLASLQSYAASKGEQGNGSPQTQAEFLVRENPQLTQQLQNAKSPQEAADAMAKAWAFAGYDKPGGEAARRQALTQNYYAQQFANQQPPQGVAPEAAIAATLPGGNNPTPSGVDPNRFASGPVAQGMPGLQTAMSAQGDAAQPQAPYVDPQVVTQQQPQSVGNAQAQTPQTTQVMPPQQPQRPGILAAGVTPLARNNLDPDLIRRLVQNPITRATGLAIAQQALGGNKPTDGWDFVKLDDGTLARANKQTGAVETLGNFLSAKHNIVSDGKNGLYDADAGKWITPPASSQGNANEFFGTTIPYRDAQGVLHYRQLGKNGQGQDVQLPEGAVAAPAVKTVDTGTGTELVGPGGASVGNIAKDVSGEAGQKTVGAAVGKAQVDLPGIVGRAQTALSSIDSLQKDPYLPSMVGSVGGTFGLLHRDELPNRSPDAARVQAKIDQIKGQSFLGVYDELRGAGAITDIEGNKGTEARARLSTAQNPEDFNAALNDLKDVIASGVARAKSMASGNTTPVANANSVTTAAASSGNIRKYNPATGKIE